jgi:hypothetical protein
LRGYESARCEKLALPLFFFFIVRLGGFFLTA